MPRVETPGVTPTALPMALPTLRGEARGGVRHCLALALMQTLM